MDLIKLLTLGLIVFKACRGFFLSNAIPVTVDPHFLKTIQSQPSNQVFIEYINHQIADIQSILPTIFANEILNERVRQSGIKIIVVAENDRQLLQEMEYAPTARYQPTRQVINIVQDSDFTLQELRQTFANELHHVLNVHTNMQKRATVQSCDPSDPDGVRYLHPFLDVYGNIDGHLAKAHREALKKADERIQILSNELNQHDEKVIEKYREVFQNYQPQIHNIPMQPESLPKLLDNLEPAKNGRNRLKLKNSNEPPMYFFKIKQYTNSANAKFTRAASDEPLDKARAFLEDYKSMQENINNGGYATFKKTHKEMELSSFIEEFNPEVKLFFFKEWCAYFSKYHHVDEYCGPKQ